MLRVLYVAFKLRNQSLIRSKTSWDHAHLYLRMFDFGNAALIQNYFDALRKMSISQWRWPLIKIWESPIRFSKDRYCHHRIPKNPSAKWDQRADKFSFLGKKEDPRQTVLKSPFKDPQEIGNFSYHANWPCSTPNEERSSRPQVRYHTILSLLEGNEPLSVAFLIPH